MTELSKRTHAAALAAVLAVTVAGCGATGATPPTRRSDAGAHRAPRGFGASPPIPGVRETQVGRGARSAWLLTGARSRLTRAPVVIFLHAWGPTGLFLYASWLRHLVGDGAAVIFPAYEDGSSSPSSALADMQVGVSLALARLGSSPASVIVAGHTTGATLALDYAASAARSGLPRACAVYGVFPAVVLGPGPSVPIAHSARLPASASITLVAGPADPVPNGGALARGLLRAAAQIPRSRRVLRESPGPNPNGPLQAGPAARATYWRPLDRLIERCAENGRTPR